MIHYQKSAARSLFLCFPKFSFYAGIEFRFSQTIIIKFDDQIINLIFDATQRYALMASLRSVIFSEATVDTLLVILSEGVKEERQGKNLI
jgi:hypothetical protein